MSIFDSKRLVRIGLVSAVIVLLGCLLKAFHLQGAAFVFVLGMMLFCVVFTPALIWRLLQMKRGIWALLSAFSSSLVLGALFKVMHWPYAEFIIAWSVSLILFGVLPLHFLKAFLTKITDDYPKEVQTQELFLGVLMTAFFATWYLLIDLSATPSVYSLLP
jgi:hypothetical protein